MIFEIEIDWIQTYKIIEDCGKKHYYDEDNNVFSLNKTYEGIRVHDDDCPCNDECYEYSEMLSAKYEGMNQ